MRHEGDNLVNVADAATVQARVRAIIVHRRTPDACGGHGDRLALHWDRLDRRTERDVRRYVGGVMRREATFDDVRDAEDQRVSADA